MYVWQYIRVLLRWGALLFGIRTDGRRGELEYHHPECLVRPQEQAGPGVRQPFWWLAAFRWPKVWIENSGLMWLYFRTMLWVALYVSDPSLVELCLPAALLYFVPVLLAVQESMLRRTHAVRAPRQPILVTTHKGPRAQRI